MIEWQPAAPARGRVQLSGPSQICPCDHLRLHETLAFNIYPNTLVVHWISPMMEDMNVVS